MEKVELKPCPHCGSKAELREHWGDCSKRPSWYEVECTNQDCGRCQDTAHEAVEAWNKRASEVNAMLADVRRLVEASQSIANTCDFMGRSHITTDKVEKLKQAIAAVERYFTREGGDPSEEKNNRLG